MLEKRRRWSRRESGSHWCLIARLRDIYLKNNENNMMDRGWEASPKMAGKIFHWTKLSRKIFLRDAAQKSFSATKQSQWDGCARDRRPLTSLLEFRCYLGGEGSPAIKLRPDEGGRGLLSRFRLTCHGMAEMATSPENQVLAASKLPLNNRVTFSQ